MVDDVVAVGRVPDEVLLLCGAPGSTPSRWWTPDLVDCVPEEMGDRLEAVRVVLDELGVRDPSTGGLRGPLRTVADVLAAATLVVLLEGERDRRALVVTEGRALLDRQVDGCHELLIASPAAAVELLAALLWTGVEPASEVRGLRGSRTTEEVAAVLPPTERVTTRITRTTVGEGVHLLTVLAHGAGSVVCWALPDGHVRVDVLDRPGAIGLARLLLGADTAEVAA